MNIFVLHKDPAEAAYMHCDKHIPKMIVETAQMLCTAAFEITKAWPNRPFTIPYKPCYTNHPCTVWARESRANFEWLLRLGYGLCNEYTKRFNKVHKTYDVICELSNVFAYIQHHFEKGLLTPFVLCMPDMYKNPGDPVDSYRKFYNGEKHFAKWQRGTPQPKWSTHGKI
jgi:hypothetical protein